MLLTTKEFEEAKRYWMSKLSGELSELKLPRDFPETRHFQLAALPIDFEDDLVEKLLRIGKNNDLSLYVLLLAALKILLYRCTGQEDIVTAAPIFNKLSQEYNKWLLLRDTLNPRATFKELLVQVKQTVSDAYKHQHYPVRRIIQLLETRDGFSLFRVILMLENLHDLQFLEDISGDFETDIMVSVRREEGRSGLTAAIRYNARLFNEDTIQSLAGHYHHILKQVLQNLNLEIADIDFLLEEEKELLQEFNNTRREYPDHKTIHQLFQEQVERTPGNIAVNTPVDFTAVYEGLKPGKIDETFSAALEKCCFKKNPFIYEHPLQFPAEPGPLYILKTHHHNSVIVNRNVLRLLELFNGETDGRSLYAALKEVDRDLIFPLYSVGREDVMEIAAKFDRREEIFFKGRGQSTFRDFIHLVRALYENHLIRLAGPGSGSIKIGTPSFGETQTIPTDIMTRENPLSKAQVLLLGDTPGMATTGLLYMASYLKRNGITARCQFTDVHDTYPSLKDNIRRLLTGIRPRVAAVSMKWFLHIARVLEICQLIKTHDLGIKVVVGGNTASYYSEKIISSPWVDYIIRGDGELPLLEICRGTRAAGVPNAVYRENGRIVRNPITYVQDRENSRDIYLSHLDEILLSDYRSVLGTFFIYTQKGCGMNCCFCAGCNRVQRETFNRGKLLIRGVEEVRKDILAAMKYASNLKFDFDVADRNLADYCKRIWEGIDLSNHFCTITNLLPPTPELIAYVNRTFKYVYWNLDIASLSGRHRQEMVSRGLIKPQPGDEEIFAFLDEVEKYPNTEFIINLIAGLPYFTGEDIVLSEKMLAHIMNNYSCFSEFFWARLHAQPGAPVVEDAEKYDMHSYAGVYEDFLEYSRKNFDKNSLYPTVEYSHYPYIYFNDDAFNSRISKHYRETNLAIERFKENKRRKLVVSVSLTYRQLNQKANRLAALLREKGVGPDSIVGLMVERSIEAVVGMLAILKAGGAYLPIDPGYPGERIRYMLNDSGANILLTQRHLIHQHPSVGSRGDNNLLYLDDETVYTGETGNPEPVNTPGDLLYVIYTSGSTGRPRGVLINHGSFANLVYYHRELFGEDSSARMSQVAALSFDAMAFEVWPCLLSGAALYIADNDTRVDPAAMKEWLIENKITISFQPTMMVERLLKEKWPGEGTALRALRAAGDRLTTYPRHSYPFQLYNLYGPTEDTVWTTWAEVPVRTETGREPVIGCPVANKQVYIVGQDNCLQPIGTPGELCISGPGTARGYLNRPGLTNKSFSGGPGGRFFKKAPLVYKTGDLGRWLPDGNLEFLGRIDHQVKIRGFRIELGEIENRLLMHKGIKEAAVVVREDKSSDKYLCAYIVAENVGGAELKEYLSGALPGYMVPSFFVPLEQIPLTPNGKVDRKALPEPGIGDPGREYTAPRDRIEETLQEIWSDVLGRKKETIGIDANFFESGGHSLKATILSTKIHKEFNVKLPLEDIFKQPTIRGLSENIKGSAEALFIAVPAVEKRDYYPLSYVQQRLYFLQQLDPANKGYNIPAVLLLEGKLEREKLEQTLQKLIQRHEAFRTAFHLSDDRPVQRVHDEVAFKIEYRGSPIPDFIRPFDLSLAPLLRVQLVREAEERHLLMVDMHHIITDGTSMGIFLKEFMTFYHGEELAPLAVQYKDYTLWQASSRQSGKESETYWCRRFEGEIPVLNLPTDFPRAAVQGFKGRRVGFQLGEETGLALKELALQEKVTPFVTLLALFNVLLAKLSGQEDIVVGTPVEGRRHADLRDIIGMFVNTLALRSRPVPGKTFRHYLAELGESTLQAFENQEYPFEDLVERVKVERILNRNPLFDVMFSLQNLDIPEIEIPGLKLTPLDLEEITARFDFTLTGMESGGNFVFTILYCSELFTRQTIERFTAYFKETAVSVLRDRKQTIAGIDIIPEEEKQLLLVDFNNTDSAYPANKTIIDLFEQQAEKKPANVSVHMAHTSYMTYKELNRKSNRLAAELIEKGVKPDSIVGIMAEPSIEMMVGVLGILKAGGAYLPIDPGFPGERINYMLTDSGAKFLLKKSEIRNPKSESPRQGHPIKNSNDQNINVQNKNLAYVIYTSGTTGKPRGAAVTNENLVNYVAWFSKAAELSPADKAVLTSSFAFDLGYTAVYPSLLNGGELHIVPKELYYSPDDLLRYIGQHRVTYLKVTPSLFSTVVDSPYFTGEMLPGLRLVVLGGEAIRLEDVEEAYTRCPHTRVMNHYGPTEATIGSVALFIDFDRFEEYKTRSTIGRPISNTAVFILDSHSALSPIGAAGELCISGAGVSAGYLNHPELTANKFIKSFSGGPGGRFYKKAPLAAGGKIYRTGDLARWLPDGNIEFLGRIDHQVKIRGFRIELEEIENHLRRHEKIEDALVIVINQHLCAYIITGEFPGLDLREYLSRALPEYMIPTHFIPLDSFPLTANNKIDRRALPEPETVPGPVENQRPLNAVEKKLVETWRQVLGRATVGLHDNFFMIGGDSIKTIQIASRLKRLGYQLEMRDIFNHPTISELAPQVKKSHRVRISHQAAVTGPLPLTPIQVEFFRRTPVDADPHHYNQAVMLYTKEELDETAVRAVFTKIQQHHDALRMTFHREKGKIDPFNHGWEYPLSLRVYHWQDWQQEKAVKALETAANQLQSSIDLEKGPLMKLALFHLADGHWLLMVVHHLVTDGVSWRILLEDIETLYRQYRSGHPLELPLKTDSFKVWSEKLTQYAKTSTTLFHEGHTYWRDLEKGCASLPAIKKDFEEEENRAQDTHAVTFRLNEAETRQLLTRANNAFGTEINHLLLTAFGLAAAGTWDLQKIPVSLESHGRQVENLFPGVDISRTVGWFTGLYPVLLDISAPGDRPDLHIKTVKEHLHRVPNSGTGYGILKYLTAAERKEGLQLDLQPQVVFNYLGQFDERMELTNFRIAGESPGITRSPRHRRKHQLEVSGMIQNRRLAISITYSQRQYKTGTIETLSEHYKTQLTRIIAYCASREARELTPCDLTYPHITIRELEELNRRCKYPVEDIYPLSPLQEGMLFHTLYERNTSAYFEQVSFRCTGRVEVAEVKRSLEALFKRHAVLRTVFLYKDFDCPLQMVFRERPADFYFEDLREKEKLVTEFKERDRQRSFDLAGDVLMRLSVLQTDNEQYEFVWSHHHILMDGWCSAILIREFFEIYNRYREKQPHRLADVRPYRDYIVWLENRDPEVSKNYWVNYLEDYNDTTGLPRLGNLPVSGDEAVYKNEQYFFTLEKEKTDLFHRLAGKSRVTLNTLVQAAWGILLLKYNRASDVVFGAVVSGRPSEIEGVESMIGLFINTIPVRIKCHGAVTFRELLTGVQADAVESEPHHYYPLAEIQANSLLKQQLLDHILVFQNYPIAPGSRESVEDGGAVTWELSHVQAFEQTNYDFNLVILPEGPLTLRFDYNANCFDSNLIQSAARHFERVVDQVLADDQLRIETITLLSREERQTLLYDFNDTDTAFPAEKTMHQLVAEQVGKTPHHIAVAGPDALQLTYEELDKRAGQLAVRLREAGVKPDQIVVIKGERSVRVVTGILAIMKAGAGYLPIQPGYPEERIRCMVEESRAKVVITGTPYMEKLQKVVGCNGQVLDLDDEGLYSGACMEGVQIENNPRHLAYVLFTSGSTGRPKGVLIEQGALVNRLYWQQREYPLGETDVLLMKALLTVDVSVMELFLGLMAGARVCLLGPGEEKEPRSMVKAVQRYHITYLHLIPAMLNLMLDYLEGCGLPSLKRVSLGGEVTYRALVRKFKRVLHETAGTTLHIFYGLTEATIDVTYYNCTFEEVAERIPIGKPIDNIRLYILDPHMQLQPIGIPGELHIAGIGLARGYLTKSFSGGPGGRLFKKAPLAAGGKIYPTGDLARWLPDGNIEFLGRIDRQVKIRGFRVEPGEIEVRLRRHEGIKDVVVSARMDSEGEVFLCAYLVPSGDLPVLPPAKELRTYLSKTLPDHMIPLHFIPLEAIPLTPNGKVNRRALPEPGPLGTGEKYEAPRDALEQKLVEIWTGILNINPGNPSIGIDDNFFDLGGHSLRATRLAARIHKEFDVEFPLKEVFQGPTVREFAQFIKSTGKSIYREIRPASKQHYYPQSSAQKRLFFLDRMEHIGTGYNMSSLLKVRGKLDREKCEKVFNQLIRRHESLRTSFEFIDNEPVQRIHDNIKFQIENKTLLGQDFIRPFDLSRAPLLRAGVVEISAEEYLFLFDMHHIIADGTSSHILMDEFARLYAGEEPPPLKIQYKDFSCWQNRLFESGKIKEQEDYWLALFSGDVPRLDLPLDYPRPNVRTFEGARHEFKLEPGDTARFNRLAADSGVTLFMNLLAVFNTLLYRYTGQEDMVVGSTIAGRPHADLERVIGMFANILPLRNRPAGEKTYREFLQEVKTAALEAFENQDMQFEELVGRLNLERDPSRNPLFDVCLTLQNLEPAVVVENRDIAFSPYPYRAETSRFDITLFARPGDDGIYFAMEYYTKIFRQETIQRLARHFLQVIREVAVEPGTGLSHIPMLSEEERRELVTGCNRTEVDYPRDMTLHRLFEQQAAKTTDKIAVIGGGYFSYRKLDEQSNRLANYLYLEKNIRVEDRVGIMMERSFECITAMLGVLKAGAAYIPIDPQYPEDRINYMMKDSGANVLLTNLPEGHHFNCQLSMNIVPGSPTNPTHLGYIIYTSGTGGRPRGVPVQHRSLVNYVYWGIRQYIDCIDKNGGSIIFPFYTSISFDLTVTSIYLPLLSGNTAAVYGDLTLPEILAAGEVDIVKATPSHLKLLQSDMAADVENSRLRTFIIGGEELQTSLAADIDRRFRGKVTIYNEYGPTEASVGCMIHRFDPAVDNRQGVSIGKPVNNVNIYILDRHLNPVPLNAAGEIYIGGDALARGYLNNPQLTAEAFTPPLTSGGTPVYRTGDFARRLWDGNVEFLGRIDEQVKIRGFRIEPREIESLLSVHGSIREVVVTVGKDAGGENYLCAYYVPHGTGEAKDGGGMNWRDYLSGRLPDYMIPAFFVPVKKIPLTANGKVDRRRLPEPAVSVAGAVETYTAPVGQWEEKLVEIWADVLGLPGETIGIHHNFFQLGGHSLKAAVMVSKVHKELNVRLPVGEIFSRPTIRGLAGYIKGMEKSIYRSIPAVEKREYYPQSSAQKRLFFLDRFETIGTGYNMPIAFKIVGEIDEERLKRTFNTLIHRHEALRTSFELVNDEAVQRVHEEENSRLQITNHKALAGHITDIIKNFVRPFDLSQPPLLRVGLWTLDRGEYLLLVDMHHIIGDGTSMGILIDEFVRLYEGETLPPLRIQYKDFACWQNRLFESVEIKGQEEYWLNLYAGNIPRLNLPTDYPRKKQATFEGDDVAFILSASDTKGFKELAEENGATLYMNLLAAFNLLLHTYTGREDIVVGGGGAGRPHADLQGIIGMFVNAWGIRNYPHEKKTYLQFLSEVKENAVKTFDNQDAQFERVVEKLNLERDSSRNPLFDVFLAAQNFERPDIDNKYMKELTFTRLELEKKISKFDLTLYTREVGDELHFNLEYSTALFKRSTIERVVKNYIEILQQAVENKHKCLKDFAISLDLVAAAPGDLENYQADFGF